MVQSATTAATSGKLGQMQQLAANNHVLTGSGSLSPRTETSTGTATSRIPYWTQHWNDVVAHYVARPRLLVACDFDGVLSPVVPHPGAARLSDEMRSLLRKLSSCPGMILTIVSGRALRDLRDRVGLDRIAYAGNYGLELAAPGFEWSSAEANTHRAELTTAVALLKLKTAEFAGALVEDKRFAATVHWRMVRSADVPRLHEVVQDVVREHPGLRLMAGNAAWEVCPQVEWNTGSALTHLLTRFELTAADAILIGGTDTEEDGFKALPDALTLRVGPAATTTARLRINDSGDTAAFLFCLLGARMAARKRSDGNERASEFSPARPAGPSALQSPNTDRQPS